MLVVYPAGMETAEEVVASKFEAIAPFLDERQQRLWVGVEARAWGRGGISAGDGGVAGEGESGGQGA